MTAPAEPTAPGPVVRTAAAAAAEAAHEAWGILNWLASTKLTGCPNLTVGRVTIRRGQSNPRHAHPNCQEVLVLLAGRLEHEVDGRWVTLEAGDTLVVDAGLPHHARSVGGTDADMVVVYDAGTREFRKAPEV